MGNPLNLFCAGDWRMQIFRQNEEISSKRESSFALLGPLALVHPARRYYRLNILVRIWIGCRFGFRDSLRNGDLNREKPTPAESRSQGRGEMWGLGSKACRRRTLQQVPLTGAVAQSGLSRP
ncbi:hypothetical protein JTE90_010538 [Oedothorax gibbosus]|uniref:Uncharacterized protein n=1 Tax=Oedothorax gibbosus TaxID=931172 RepID=A0AAV6TJ29_9ARAC|nr:hypothetical protein JTE90_010538 [Oedothorax gibbosus]